MNGIVKAISHLSRNVFCIALVSAWTCAELGAELVVSNVRAAQRVITIPEDAKMVDIWYDLQDDGKGTAAPVYVLVSISDDDAKTFAIPAITFEGNYGAGQTAGKDKLVTWNAGVDWDGKVCPDIRFLLNGPPPPGAGDGDDTTAPPMRTFASPPPPVIIDDDDDTGLGDPKPSALSNRTFVDTRDPEGENLDALAGVPMLVDERPGKDRLISYEMTMQTLPRPSAGTVTVYSQIKIPNFAEKNGGWGAVAGGLGTFYGLEMTSQFLRDDSIQYKVGGNRPTPNTPEIEWKPAFFDTIIDTFIDDGPLKKGGPLKEETYYFKITLSSPGNGSFVDISAQFKSARLCTNMGEPVKALKSGLPLWLIVHGKNDGEKSFRSMNTSVRKGTGSLEVVNLDWASGSEGFGLGNGRYFINLAKSVTHFLRENHFSSSGVNFIGHSWGTLVGYETARAFGRFSIVNRFIALDPATQALGGYDDDRVDFKSISTFATGIKGGGSQLLGLYGSEAFASG